MRPLPYNSNIQIVQTREFAVIESEMMHDVRAIPLDERPHLPPRMRQWQGDSRGHWERDTLVVDTTNFTSTTHVFGAGDGLHVVERFTRVDAHTLLYSFTVDDPATFTTAWTAEFPLRKIAGPLYEYACHEGNYSMEGALRGARAQEK